MADPEFPRRMLGVKTPHLGGTNLVSWVLFPQKCMKSKKIGPSRGKGVPSNPPSHWIRQWPLKKALIESKHEIIFPYYGCTGREQLIRSHSSTRFCFKLSGNLN